MRSQFPRMNANMSMQYGAWLTPVLTLDLKTGEYFPPSPPTVSPVQLDADILFIDDLAQVLRTSKTTIERRRRDGSLPFPELPAIDKRPRWSRLVVEEFLSSSNGGVRRHPRRQPFSPTKRVKR